MPDDKSSSTILPRIAPGCNRATLQVSANVFRKLLHRRVAPLRLLMHRLQHDRVQVPAETAAQPGRRAVAQAAPRLIGRDGGLSGIVGRFHCHAGLIMTRLGRSGSHSQITRASSWGTCVFFGYGERPVSN